MEPNYIKHKKEGRSRETLFRVAYQHQGQLLQLADYKASLIISISTLIISGIVAIVGFNMAYGKGEDYIFILAAPAVVIVVACLLTLVFAIQAAKPKFIFTHTHSHDDNKSSLLFFRSMASHPQKEYLERMKELLEDDDQIYEQMTLDLYNQGVVLKRKYDLLRNAYTVLMLGFVASVLAFLVMLLTQ